MIPKQYNPTIIAPAFHIFISSPSMSSWENQRLIMNELENKLMEIKANPMSIFWVSWDNYVWVMAKFHVGENAENAKIRLNQKLSQNMDLKPIGVENPIIKTLNPDELSNYLRDFLYLKWKYFPARKTNISSSSSKYDKRGIKSH